MGKCVVVCGAVISGSGKGVAASSIALLLKQRSFNVNYLKFDPYFCLSAGTLSPAEHGETYVLNGNGKSGENSVECDLDLGHVERVTGLTLTKDSICTSGMLFKELIEDQEQGKYLGKTITSCPYLTDKIINRIEKLSENSNVIVEIGGSVDDIESGIYLQAICQLKQKHPKDCLVVVVAPVLWLDVIEEFKTKPLQRGIRDLQSYGIIPDILICRSSKKIPEEILRKIHDSTNIPRDCIFVGPDCKSIYEVPLQFYDQSLDDVIVDKLSLKRNPCRISQYRNLVEGHKNAKDLKEITLAVVGKYANFSEAYLSLKEACNHAAIHNGIKLTIKWILTSEIENKGAEEFLKDVDAVIVPGGFDSRGVNEKILTIKYCRENNVPILGICLGLQCMAIEIARNVCKLENANSVEFNKKTPYPVVHYLPGQENIKNKSGTMRLGAYECELENDSLARELYENKIVSERHRHRLEINEEFVEGFSKVGFVVSGRNPEKKLIEFMELKGHNFFLGLQGHPEYKSRLMEPAPVFCGLLKAAIKYKEGKNGQV